MVKPALRDMHEELGYLIGRALPLGDAASWLLARVLTALAIVALGWIAYRIVTGFVGRLLRAREAADPGSARTQRVRTLGPLLTSVARYAVALAVGILILKEVGIDIGALAVSAGLAGLAIGFGAQSLIRDVITGFFMLFENLIAVGDVIEVGAHTGVVESVGLRVTKIRKFSGELRIVPNGELTAFSHHAAGWARAIVEVSIRHDQDVAAALRILGEVGRDLQAAHPVEILEAPVAEGILRFESAAAVLRMHTRVTALQKFPLELELRILVKEAFDRAGLQMALPQMRVAVDPSLQVIIPDPIRPDPIRKESAA